VLPKSRATDTVPNVHHLLLVEIIAQLPKTFNGQTIQQKVQKTNSLVVFWLRLSKPAGHHALVRQAEVDMARTLIVILGQRQQPMKSQRGSTQNFAIFETLKDVTQTHQGAFWRERGTYTVNAPAVTTYSRNDHLSAATLTIGGGREMLCKGLNDGPIEAPVPRMKGSYVVLRVHQQRGVRILLC
jgi:hypothetical protein